MFLLAYYSEHFILFHQADTQVEFEKKAFYTASMKYVLKLQEVQERKKFEFVEIVSFIAMFWSLFFVVFLFYFVFIFLKPCFSFFFFFGAVSASSFTTFHMFYICHYVLTCKEKQNQNNSHQTVFVPFIFALVDASQSCPIWNDCLCHFKTFWMISSYHLYHLTHQYFLSVSLLRQFK